MPRSRGPLRARRAWQAPAALLAAIVLTAACAPPGNGAPIAATRSAPPDAAELTLGAFRIDGERAAVDGDTLRVRGIDSVVRLVGLDTEERLTDPGDREDAARDFASYARRNRGDSRRPVKYGTPLGDEATSFARSFFAGHREVRLELDAQGRGHGYFGRPLAHAFVERDGGDGHYNLEAVRAGMSPYFVKYGRSQRFDSEFRAAQSEARRERRGIWSAAAAHYPDYDERLAWWEERARAIARFDAAAQGKNDWFRLGDDGVWDALIAREGRVVTLLGALGSARTDRKPYLLPLSHRLRRDVNIVDWDRSFLRRFADEAGSSDHVQVRGRVSLHRGRPQILYEDVEEVRAP